MDAMVEKVSSWILAAGAFGTAAFGFVEALKAKGWIGLAGMRELRASLEKPAKGVLMRLLARVYGSEDFAALLESTYRRGPADTSEFLRNGLRLALSSDLSAEERVQAAEALGQDPQQLQRAYERVARETQEVGAEEVTLAERKVIGQAELVIDARVEAAVCHADAVLSGRKRWIAGIFAVSASLGLALLAEKRDPASLAQALLVGIVAVPIAPITRDLVSLLQSARDALRGRAA